ncbi:MAG TPA: CocE/NonD family hydrolase [Bryobacteraceae bacterium]|nr:CocE/NonD family hydrolase [Bryobacteraceae bacterium]
MSRVPMRDGVRLATSVFLPSPTGRHPVLLVRTPYGKGKDLLPGYHLFLKSGFAIVVQDVRGRYDSEGHFRAFTQEMNDGDDTLTWIAKQPWSTGRIGMVGGSYLGIAQWRAALSGNPHLAAIFPVVAGADEYKDRFYSPGGGFKVGHRLLWTADNLRAPGFQPPPFEEFVRHLPLRTADQIATGRAVDFWQEALNHPSYDSWWRARSTFERIASVRVPAFIVGGWYDNYVESDLAAWVALRKHSTAHRIVIGPWGHSMTERFTSGITFGRDSYMPVRRTQLRWFQHWMNEPQPAREFPGGPVRLFVMGINEWRDESAWPPVDVRYMPLYLHSTAGANSLGGDGVLDWQVPTRPGRDTFVYDPRNPVPTRGGAVCCNPKIFPDGPMDQRDVETRSDVLVYTTAPLRDDLEVTGPVTVVLRVATTAPDTDFTAKLVDVFPDGHARNLCDGMLRLRYREGLSSPRLARPGEVYSINIGAGVTSNVFRQGHRIRLEISSSNFPRFDRNLNTGRANADEREIRVARQKVLHGGEGASHVLLPVVPKRRP